MVVLKVKGLGVNAARSKDLIGSNEINMFLKLEGGSVKFVDCKFQ